MASPRLWAGERVRIFVLHNRREAANEISFNSSEHCYTYSSTLPFHGKPISLNAGRTTSGLDAECVFTAPEGVIESFGTKTGGGSYLEGDPAAFSMKLLPITFSVERCKGDPSLKEVGRAVCENVRAGGVTSL